MGSGTEPAGGVGYVPTPRREGAFSHVDELGLEPCAIEPSWVRTGVPRTRAALHSRALDGLASTVIWECTRGTFQWYFGWEETVMILEGQVKVTSEGGTTRVLRAGDIGYFPANSTWFWEVDDYVRKIAFCRKQVPVTLRFATRVLARLDVTNRVAERGAAAFQRLRRICGRATGIFSALVLLSTLPF